MPIKKSDLYSSLWASCDELRGGMDASQYKDYSYCVTPVSLVVDWLWRSWTASRSWASAMAISQRRVGIESATCR